MNIQKRKSSNRAVQLSTTNAGTLFELFHALLAHKRAWMLPMVVVLLLTSLLLVVVAAVEYVAPFVYTLF